MLHKTLFTLATLAALGIGSTAIARQGGMGSTMQGSNMGVMQGGGTGRMGPMTQGSMTQGSMTQGSMTQGSRIGTAPAANGPIQGWGGRTFSRNNFALRFHDHFHHRFHHRHLFAFGAIGPLYDSCWRLVRTYYGWQRVYVCGDYWGY